MRTPLSELNKPQEVSPPEHTTAETPVSFNGVPVDLARHFAIDVRDVDEGTKRYLQDIYTWASETSQEPMEYIGNLRRKLGEPRGEPAFLKMWNWMCASRQVREMNGRNR